MSETLVTHIDDSREWLPQADVLAAIGCGRTYLWGIRNDGLLSEGHGWRRNHRGHVFFNRDALNDLLADQQGVR